MIAYSAARDTEHVDSLWLSGIYLELPRALKKLLFCASSKLLTIIIEFIVRAVAHFALDIFKTIFCSPRSTVSGTHTFLPQQFYCSSDGNAGSACASLHTSIE